MRIVPSAAVTNMSVEPVLVLDMSSHISIDEGEVRCLIVDVGGDATQRRDLARERIETRIVLRLRHDRAAMSSTGARSSDAVHRISHGVLHAGGHF